MDALENLAKELGYPSAEKLFRASERRGLGIPRNIINAYVRAQGQRQIFAARPRYRGKIVATKVGDRFAADLIDYANRETKDGYQYILIVQDTFSRKIWAVAMKDKTPSVTQPAFEYIVRSSGTPRMLDTDDGAEFKGPFEEYLKDNNIEHSIADARNKNARGILDHAIRELRQILARFQVSGGTRNWASFVAQAANAYNETDHFALIGRNPDEIASDNDAKFLLSERAAQGIQHNQREIEQRGKRLEQLGAFRNENPHEGRGFERFRKPRYGDEVHRVNEVVGGTVISNGIAYPTRHALAVPAASTRTAAQDLRTGNPVLDNQRREALEPHKANIAAFIGAGKWEYLVANHMKTLGLQALMVRGFNYRKAIKLMGFRVAPNGLVTVPPG